MRARDIDRSGPIMNHDASIAALGINFAELGAVLSTADEPTLNPERVARLAARAMTNSDAASITLRANQAPSTLAASGKLARLVDALQAVTQEGPCLDAAISDIVESTGDVAADRRWPTFGPRCESETGVRSVLAIRLALTGDDRGALNFFSLRGCLR